MSWSAFVRHRVRPGAEGVSSLAARQLPHAGFALAVHKLWISGD
jgi:hypothetical protein